LLGDPKTVVVVPVAGIVPVAVGGTAVVCIIVPAAAAQHPGVAFLSPPPIVIGSIAAGCDHLQLAGLRFLLFNPAA
jgi:hypothetical protein